MKSALILVASVLVSVVSSGMYVPTAYAVNTFMITETFSCSGLPSLWRAEAVFNYTFKGGFESSFIVCVDNQTVQSTGTTSLVGRFTEWSITVKIIDAGSTTVAQNSAGGHALKGMTVTAMTADGTIAATASAQIVRL